MTHNTTLEFAMILDKDPTKLEEMQFRPRKVGTRFSKKNFTIVRKSAPNVVLATVVRAEKGINLIIKKPEEFSRADSQRALNHIGTAMATELSRLREIQSVNKGQ